MCVGGALATSLYKGKEFYIGHHHHHSHHSSEISAVAAHKTHMLRGTFFLVGACCSYTAWFILQVCLFSLFICDSLSLFFLALFFRISSTIIF